MSTQPSAPNATTTVYERGPNLLVRVIIAVLMFNRTPFIASLYRYGAVVGAVRGTLRPAVLLGLLTWMFVVGIPVIFRGGSVRSIVNSCSDPRCGGMPWEAIWLVGCVAILAVGFLTRARISNR